MANNQQTYSDIKVIVQKGQVRKTEFSFSNSFRIGRDEGCDLQLFDDAVSRFHAEVRFEDGNWWLHDLNSRNGIFIGNQRSDKVLLKNSDCIILSEGGTGRKLSVFLPEHLWNKVLR